MEVDQLAALVRHHLATGREAQGADLLSEHLQEHQEQHDFWQLMALCQLRLDNPQAAEQAARTALGIEPHNAGSAIHLALALAARQRRAEALPVLYQVIAEAPELAAGHYYYAAVLLGAIRSHDDLLQARKAIGQALALEPENPDYHQLAAVAANADDDHASALGHLADGLAIDPNHQGLLLAAGKIKGAEQLVGQQYELLRGLLAADPVNERLHEDFAQDFLSRARVYAHRFWGFAPLASALAAVSSTVASSVLSGVFTGVLLVAAGGFAWWNLRTWKKSCSVLPAGYLADVQARFPRLRPALWAYRASWGAGTVGVVLACWPVLPVPASAGLLAASVLAALAGRVLVDSEAAGVPHGAQGKQARHRYLLQASGQAAGDARMRLAMVALLFASAVPGLALGTWQCGIPLLALGAGVLLPGLQLAWWSLALGPAGNAFAYGSSVSARASRRPLALLRGNLAALCHIGVHLLLGASMLVLGIQLLAGSGFDDAGPQVPAHAPQPARQLPENFLDPAPEPSLKPLDLPSFEVPGSKG